MRLLTYLKRTIDFHQYGLNDDLSLRAPIPVPIVLKKPLNPLKTIDEHLSSFVVNRVNREIKTPYAEAARML